MDRGHIETRTIRAAGSALVEAFGYYLTHEVSSHQWQPLLPGFNSSAAGWDLALNGVEVQNGDSVSGFFRWKCSQSYSSLPASRKGLSAL